MREIGRFLDRPHNAISRHLSLIAAERQRKFYHSYYQANLESQRERNRCNYKANAEKRRNYACAYRKLNADKVRKSKRLWIKANPEWARQKARRYYESNTDRILERSRAWAAANPDKVFHKTRRRNAWKRAARRHALQPVTRQQIDARFALWNNRCAFCGVDASHQRNHGRERLTVEHVLALTKGGLDEASNIIPACTSCNTSKHNSPVETWYRRQPWFTEARWRKIQRHCPAAVVGQLPLAL